MTFHTCRFCRQWGKTSYIVKYGVRHYAHFECLVKAFTPDAFRSLMIKLPLFQLQQLPVVEAMKLGVAEVIASVLAERKPR